MSIFARMRGRGVVLASLEDEGGDRCVDLLREGEAFGWVECRRDPEDGFGWRRLHPPRTGFGDVSQARSDAVAAVGWLAPEPVAGAS